MNPVADKPKYDEDLAFDRVMTACRAAEAKGWTIARRTFVDTSAGRCCPIGAFAVEAGLESSPFAPQKAVELWKAAVQLWKRPPARRPFGGFTGVIDWGDKMHASPQRRDIRLARRVRAALWPDGTP